jgi:hypothetical protein
MKKTFFLTVTAAGALLAQAPQIIEDKIIGEKQVHVITRGAAGQAGSAGTFSFMSAEASFETSVVKGAPFSGDFVTENTQALADGNRIRNSNTTFYARDGEGRTRREITINAIGPFPAEAGKHIFIHDPVAKVDYVLDPQEKTARKVMLGGMFTQAIPAMPMKEGGPAVAFTHRVEGPLPAEPGEGVGGHAVTMQRMPLPAGIVMQGQAGATFSRTDTASFSAVSDAKFKNDTLGKRIIEGVEAEGTRTTITIPAGQIGNDLPLDTISERWYSNELKTVVMTTRKDPRSGESTYKLTNLRRGEPSRQLFELPADYKVITEDNVGPLMRMKIDRKQDE